MEQTQGDSYERLARRERRRRERRRRRWRAAIVLALVVLAAAGVSGALLARGGSGSSAASGLEPAKSHPRRARTPRRALTPVATGKPGTQPVPILMYHVIAPPLPTAPYPGLYVPPAEFSAQMQALAHAGYHAVTLDRVRSYWLRGTRLPRRPIVLSFDNGYRSQYERALPVLRRLGWVGVENIQLSGLPPSEGGLNRAQVRGLVAAGWELDTQGFTHADLNTIDAAGLHHEVAVARRVIRRRYHVPVNWFCYPSGHYDATVLAAVRAAGYAGATTVVPGWARPGEDPYRLPRLRVLGGTSAGALLALVAASRGDTTPPPAYPAA